MLLVPGMCIALTTKYPVTAACPLMLYWHPSQLDHLIGKVDHCHFLAAEEHRQRVIQIGEHPDRVFLVGGPATTSMWMGL